MVALQGLVHDGLHLAAVPGLEHVAVHVSEPDGLHEHILVPKGREDDAHGVGAHLPGVAQKLGAGHLRHTLVGDDHRHLVLAQNFQPRGAGQGRVQVEGLSEIEAEGVQVVLLVVHQEHGVGQVRLVGTRGGHDLRY